MQLEEFRSLQSLRRPMVESVMHDKLQYLEGLRGIAAFIVVLGHLKATFWPDLELVWAGLASNGSDGLTLAGVLNFLGQTFAQALYAGVDAVWIFFVLSGFVLSYQFHLQPDIESAGQLLASAAVKRYPRLLLPTFASVVLAWGLHANGWMTNGKLASMLGPEYDSWLGSFYVFESDLLQAVKFALWESFFTYNAATTYNAVLWTMGPELYGSLFVFGLLALVGKQGVRYPLYVIIGLIIWSLRLYWLDAFLAGCVLCDMYVNRSHVLAVVPAPIRAFVGSASINATVSFLTGMGLVFAVGLQTGNQLAHLVIASLATGFVVASSPAQRLFCLRRVVWLGKVSFGLYLTHLLVICSLAFPLYTTLSRSMSSEGAAILSALCLLFVSLAVGWGFWFMVDRPAVRLAHLIVEASVARDRTVVVDRVKGCAATRRELGE